MSAQQRQLLIDNLVGALREVTRVGIVRRMLDHCRKVPPEFGEGIAKVLGIRA